jgi:hypothetical protein
MVDIALLLMVIASAISLLVVSPRDLQRKALLALRECEETARAREKEIPQYDSQHGSAGTREVVAENDFARPDRSDEDNSGVFADPLTGATCWSPAIDSLRIKASNPLSRFGLWASDFSRETAHVANPMRSKERLLK